MRLADGRTAGAYLVAVCGVARDRPDDLRVVWLPPQPDGRPRGAAARPSQCGDARRRRDGRGRVVGRAPPLPPDRADPDPARTLLLCLLRHNTPERLNRARPVRAGPPAAS